MIRSKNMIENTINLIFGKKVVLYQREYAIFVLWGLMYFTEQNGP